VRCRRLCAALGRHSTSPFLSTHTRDISCNTGTEFALAEPVACPAVPQQCHPSQRHPQAARSASKGRCGSQLSCGTVDAMMVGSPPQSIDDTEH
jgi:hypothetical protein